MTENSAIIKAMATKDEEQMFALNGVSIERNEEDIQKWMKVCQAYPSHKTMFN